MSSEQTAIYQDPVENYLQARFTKILFFSLLTILVGLILFNSLNEYISTKDKLVMNDLAYTEESDVLENKIDVTTIESPETSPSIKAPETSPSIKANNLLTLPTKSDTIPKQVSKIATIKSGDSLNKILSTNSFTQSDIVKITKALSLAKINPKLILTIGKKIELFYDNTTNTKSFNKIVIELNDLEKIEILAQKDNFIAKKVTLTVEKFLTRRSAGISNKNLPKALLALGVSQRQSQEILDSFKQQLNFNEILNTSAKVHVVLEKNVIPESGKVKYGNILLVSLSVGNKNYNIYRYDAGFGSSQYFSESGKALKATLLKPPVKGVARVSSRFGIRTLNGYTRMHSGVDFAAPLGSDILSVGDGIVMKTGWANGHGKFIEIKHSQDYSTLYAHLKSFSKGLSVGTKVKQGQVIGLVGMTGRTYGPHIHLELKYKGKKVDFLRHAPQIKHEMTPKTLQAFKNFKNYLASVTSKFNTSNINEVALGNKSIPGLNSSKK
ncbi:MAG: M23 family metallopeptidase [Rickettsiaceae bacterium]|nr:M23 family metallopeptidase [Rickettsiaceae bacterium]